MKHILFSLALSVAAVSFGGCASSGDDSTEVSNEDTVTAPGSFDLWQAADGQWHFHLVAGNHRILVTSEAYESRTGALSGALSVMNNGVDPARYRVVQAANGWLLHVVAGNGEIIGHTQSYSSKSNATRAIDACVRALTSYLDHTVTAAGARAEVQAGDTGQFHFNLFAQNGEIILSSESYATEAAAWNGAFSAQGASANAESFSIETATDGAYYFTLRAAQNENVGISEM
jgi:uncharacterized protein